MKIFSTKQLKKNISNNTWYPHYANHKFTILELHLKKKKFHMMRHNFFTEKSLNRFRIGQYGLLFNITKFNKMTTILFPPISYPEVMFYVTNKCAGLLLNKHFSVN